MRIWRRIRREFSLRRYFRVGPSWERLARMRAYRMNGNELEVIEIIPHDGGCFVRLTDPYPMDHHSMIWVNKPVEVKNGKIRVQYQKEPEQMLVTIYGWHNYQQEPTAYLTMAG